MARACRAAKARDDRRERNLIDEGRVEDRPCVSCGIELPERPWRITDLEVGRWCRKTRCQELKAQARRGKTDTDTIDEMFRQAWRFKGDYATCPDCGLPNAVRGFVHPRPDFKRLDEPCRATGGLMPSPAATEVVWPEVLYREHPEMLEAVMFRLRSEGLRD